MKLRFARIVTGNVPALARFYRALTGIDPEGNDAYLEFTTPVTSLTISGQRIMTLHGADATVPAANRSLILDFQVADVDAERARLQDLVGSFVLDPTDQPWGNRSMLFRDPDGNLINFFAPINR